MGHSPLPLALLEIFSYCRLLQDLKADCSHQSHVYIFSSVIIRDRNISSS
jgi:hypothetical protein